MAEGDSDTVTVEFSRPALAVVVALLEKAEPSVKVEVVEYSPGKAELRIEEAHQ